LTVAGKYAYVGAVSGYGLRRAEFSDPHDPTEVGFYGAFGRRPGDVVVVDAQEVTRLYRRQWGWAIILRFLPYQVYLAGVQRNNRREASRRLNPRGTERPPRPGGPGRSVGVSGASIQALDDQGSGESNISQLLYLPVERGNATTSLITSGMNTSGRGSGGQALSVAAFFQGLILVTRTDQAH